MSNVKISELPYVGRTGFTSNDIVPFVNYLDPSGTTSETKIDDLTEYVLDNSFVQNIIKVGKGGNVQFTTLYDAVQSITGSSFTNRYSIQVGPGIYVEPSIDLSNKPYISIVGADINTVLITPDDPSNIVFNLGNTGEISFLTISGATSGIGISCEDIDGFALVHKVSMYDNDVHISVTSSVSNTQFYGEYIDLNGLYSYGVYVSANNGYSSLVSLENHFNFPSGSATIANFCQGLGSLLSFNSGDCVGVNTPGSIAFKSEDYANLLISNVNIRGWDVGVYFPNVGGACYFDIDGISIFNSNTYDLQVDNPQTKGTIQGSLSHQYISNSSENVFWSFLDHEDGELDITRKVSVTFKDGTHTDLSTLIFEGGTMGVLEGGVITILSGLTINISEGYGYLESIINNGIIKRYDWADIKHILPANSNQYIYINQNGILSNTGTRPNSIYNIVLGRVVTNSTDIIMIDASPLNANHTSNLYGNLFRNALGPIYDSGSIVTENVTPYHLDVTGGDYYYSTNEYLPSGGTNITFIMYYSDGTTGWTTSATTEVVNGYDDGSGTISPLPTTAFTKHTLYVVGDGINEQYFLVLGQNQYPTLVQTENGLLPTPPPYFDDSVTQIASIYVQQGASNIIQIEDIRPVIGFKAGGVNASSLHANLLGLSADDHTQYLLVDGSRAMEGDLNMGGNDIYSAGTITSNVISATTYQNLPVDPNTFVTGFTYGNNVFTLQQNNGQPDLTASINNVTGWTVNGNLTATTISATTYQNLPVDPNTFVTAFTYNNNVLTLKQNNGQPDLTTVINSVTGWTVTGGLTATTISASTYLNVPSFVNMVLGHSSVGPADATTYYIGALQSLTPSTANRDAWTVNSQYTGSITEVSIISNFGGGSSENSTITLHNLSASTSQVVTSTLQYVSGTPVSIIVEPFSSGTQPAGWTSFQTTFVAGASPYAGLTGTTSTLTSPSIDGTAYASLNVSTEVAKFGAGTDGPILIEYSLNNGISYTSAGTTATPTGSTNYVSSTVSIPATSSQMLIRFSVNPTGTSGKRLRNVTISGLSSSINNNYVLGTPLSVTSGDRLQIRWVTPTWSTNPSGVTNLFNLKLRL